MGPDLGARRALIRQWGRIHAPGPSPPAPWCSSRHRPRCLSLPVLLWFPGGAFETGSASIFDGSSLAAYEDMLVVIVQYRLGIFGFFTTWDQHAPGNWAFKDQVAALSWVQKNIEFFGGDPSSVTIFGESVGAISVSSLMLSPMAEGLFHKAIMESGVAIILYLKAHDYEKSEDKTKAFTQVVDGAFFPNEPLDLLSEKAFKAIPSIIGVNNPKCGFPLPMHILPNCLHLVASEYFHDKRSLTEIRDSLLDLLRDVFFVIPKLITARYHRGESLSTPLQDHSPARLMAKEIHVVY
ncbi:carboxylesterase 5A-like isoform X2 [Gorilla gorilla gorilla]|uniref:carboxylesterase 5A-like isoform X2 n=1 Tax=Gorilla gorilla gorilla TaxID=9595 RepID=UPI002445A79E|nr:carboxylesterase 5A-like isoform X2 [Gorilla gorilla gorilla]